MIQTENLEIVHMTDLEQVVVFLDAVAYSFTTINIWRKAFGIRPTFIVNVMNVDSSVKTRWISIV